MYYYRDIVKVSWDCILYYVVSPSFLPSFCIWSRETKYEEYKKSKSFIVSSCFLTLNITRDDTESNIKTDCSFFSPCSFFLQS